VWSSRSFLALATPYVAAVLIIAAMSQVVADDETGSHLFVAALISTAPTGAILYLLGGGRAMALATFAVADHVPWLARIVPILGFGVMAVLNAFSMQVVVRAASRAIRRRTKWYGDCPDCGHDWRAHIPPEPCSGCQYSIVHQESDAPDTACTAPRPSSPSR
jgi:hypothetical protein